MSPGQRRALLRWLCLACEDEKSQTLPCRLGRPLAPVVQASSGRLSPTSAGAVGALWPRAGCHRAALVLGELQPDALEHWGPGVHM